MHCQVYIANMHLKMPVIKIGFLNYFYHLTAKTISFPKNRMEFAGCKNFFLIF